MRINTFEGKMKIQIIKQSVLVSTVLFILTVSASGQLLKPGEIIYGRTQSETNGACTTAAVWAVGQDGSNDRFITFGRHPRISPDGRKILFKRWASNVSCGSGFEGFFGWFIRDLATGVEVQIGGQNGTASGAFFTPETNRASLQITAEEGGAMCQLNISGGRTCFNIQIEPIRGFGHPSVRGGDYVIAAQNYDGNTNGVGGLYTFNYDRTNIQKIPNTTFLDLSPSWSNTGQDIAYALYVNPCCRTAPYFFVNLFKIKPDGTSKTQLTNVTNLPPGSGFAYSLVWSEDNSTIYNAARLNNITGIYKIDANGGGILGLVPTTPGQPIEWVGGIAPAYGEKEIASWGGGVTTGGSYTLIDTIGQAFAGQTSEGGTFKLQSGFWTADTNKTLFDFDGDGKSDVSVYRPSIGNWFLRRSTQGFTGVQFGAASDLLVPADYDGDGQTDIAVFRPSTGVWFALNSSNNTVFSTQWGTAGDIPRPADFDGDGRADVNIFRPSAGYWYRLNSSDGQFVGVAFGTNGDIPQPADFDGDGKADINVFRPSAGGWYRLNSSNGSFTGLQFGSSGDIPTVADYDGDGKADISVFRPSSGSWFRLNSSNNGFVGTSWGQNGDIPTAADYDGDGKADIAVFRAGTWYLLQSQNGFLNISFGTSSDAPIPAAFQF